MLKNQLFLRLCLTFEPRSRMQNCYPYLMRLGRILRPSPAQSTIGTPRTIQYRPRFPHLNWLSTQLLSAANRYLSQRQLQVAFIRSHLRRNRVQAINTLRSDLSLIQQTRLCLLLALAPKLACLAHFEPKQVRRQRLAAHLTSLLARASQIMEQARHLHQSLLSMAA